jgi:hypothetical protein
MLLDRDGEIEFACPEARRRASRQDALDRLGLTARESEVLRAAAVMEGEVELAWELFLS